MNERVKFVAAMLEAEESSERSANASESAENRTTRGKNEAGERAGISGSVAGAPHASVGDKIHHREPPHAFGCGAASHTPLTFSPPSPSKMLTG
jgi:hypothetical protein